MVQNVLFSWKQMQSDLLAWMPVQVFKPNTFQCVRVQIDINKYIMIIGMLHWENNVPNQYSFVQLSLDQKRMDYFHRVIADTLFLLGCTWKSWFFFSMGCILVISACNNDGLCKCLHFTWLQSNWCFNVSN